MYQKEYIIRYHLGPIIFILHITESHGHWILSSWCVLKKRSHYVTNNKLCICKLQDLNFIEDLKPESLQINQYNLSLFKSSVHLEITSSKVCQLQ